MNIAAKSTLMGLGFYALAGGLGFVAVGLSWAYELNMFLAVIASFQGFKHLYWGLDHYSKGVDALCVRCGQRWKILKVPTQPLSQNERLMMLGNVGVTEGFICKACRHVVCFRCHCFSNGECAQCHEIDLSRIFLQEIENQAWKKA